MLPELRHRPPTPLPDALARLQAAVSPLTGIVRGTHMLTHATDEPRLPQAACGLASARRTLGDDAVEQASSASVSPEAALAGALGEALERYSGIYVHPERLVLGRADELGGAALDPGRCALFHPAQYRLEGFPFVPFTGSLRLHWAPASDLRTGETVFLPAQLVYLRPPTAGEPRIAYSTSNGLACGATAEEATLAALLEVVERDAVMLAWKNRLSLPLLDWSGDAVVERLDRRYFAPTRLRYAALDASAFFGIPVVIGVVRGARAGGPGIALGAGAAATVADAVRSALAEAFSVHRWVSNIVLFGGPLPRTAAEIRTFEDHVAYYGAPAKTAVTSFLDASAERTHTSAVPSVPGATALARIEAVVERLAARGVTAYAADVTSPDVAELGLHVARVVCPELCALDVLGTAPYLGGERLYRAAHDAGLLPAVLTPGDLNLEPHPFP